MSSYTHQFESSAILCIICVSMPPAVRPSLIKIVGLGFLTCATILVQAMRNSLRACYAPKGKIGTDESAKVLTENSPSPCLNKDSNPQ